MDRSRIEPRKVPVQARSRKTYDAILKAAGQILMQEGQAGLTTNRVAERAGVSIGSLYQYFPNKHVIVVALMRDMRAGMLAEMERAAARDAEPLDVIKAIVQARLHAHLRDPERVAALERIEGELPEDPEVQSSKRQMHALIVNVLAERYADDPETIARDLVGLCHGMAQAAVDAGERDGKLIGQRLDRALSGYLEGVIPDD